jgi:RNA polymerase sigma factor (sigma-70 family)
VGADEPASDAELLERFVRARRASCSAESDEAFGELVRRHSRLVWAACRHLLPNQADAEDAFQVVFLALARGPERVRDPAALAAWLHATAVRTATLVNRTTARRRARERVAAKQEASAPVSETGWARLLAAVHDEVARLPVPLRAAFILCDLEGVPQPVAATRLGCKPGTLTGRLCRARERLLAQLTQRGLAQVAAAGVVAVGTAAVAEVPQVVAARAAGFAADGAAMVSGTVSELTRAITEATMTRVKLLAAGLMVATALGLGTVVVTRAEAQPQGVAPPGGPGSTTPEGQTVPPPGEGAPERDLTNEDPGFDSQLGVKQSPFNSYLQKLSRKADAGPGRPPLQYRIVDLKDDTRASLAAALADQGNAGWEFCSVAWVRPTPGGNPQFVAVFKRTTPTAIGGGGGGGGFGGSAFTKPAGTETLRYPLKNILATEAAVILREIFGQLGTPEMRGQGVPGQPGTLQPEAKAGVKPLAVTADERTNTVILSGSPADIAVARKILETADHKPAPKNDNSGGPPPTGGSPPTKPGDTPLFKTFSLKHAKAEEVAAVLTKVYRDRDGSFRVVAERASNTLILVKVSPADLETIRVLIEALDRPAPKTP